MIVDLYCHILPKEVIAQYTKMRLPFLLRFVQPTFGGEDLRFADLEFRIRLMDKLGIDMEVLTMPYNVIWETISLDESMKLSKILNNSMAAIAEKYPNRFAAVATLPFLTGEALDELDRCISELGLKGVLTFTNINGKPLDSPEFELFFDDMAKYDLPIWLHPVHWPYYEWFGYKNDLTHIFGYPFETAVAAARLSYGGVLEKHPNLKIILHHLGGMVPLVAGRIEEFYEMALNHPQVFGEQYSGLRLSKRPVEYFKMMYADTVACGVRSVLQSGYDFYGPEHIVFGTDYPFGPEMGERWTRKLLNMVGNMRISEDERQLILAGNAKRLLRIA